MPIRVVVVDDTDDIRFLVKLALRLDGRFEVVGEAADGVSAINVVTALRPDVVVLDIAMPIMDGLQALPEIKRLSPETKVVILSGFNITKVEEDARRRGADRYLEKGTKPSEICAALAEVVRGKDGEAAMPLVTGKYHDGEGDDPNAKNN